MSPNTPAHGTPRRLGRGTVIAVAAVFAAALLSFLGFRYWATSCCAPPPQRILAVARPSDFAIVVESGTGSLAPAYHHDYEIRIDSAGRGTLKYWPGYGQEDSVLVTATFTVSDSVANVLYELSRALWSSPGPVSARDIPDGGASSRVTLTGNGRDKIVEPWQPERWRVSVDSVTRAAHAAVPDSIWTRCLEAQDRYGKARERGKPLD